MNRVTRKMIWGTCLSVLVAGTVWSRGIEAPSALVVIPTRQRVVEFGFDLIRQQGVALVAYHQDGNDLLLNLWNGREWVPLTPAAYASGTFLLGPPKQVILLGDDRLLPTLFQTVPDWCNKTKRIQVLDTATLVNECGTLLKFDDYQWKWFSGKYGLALTDSNAARRRWGKYGPPGHEWYRHQPPVKGETVLPPPGVPATPLPPTESVQPVPTVRVIPDNVPIIPTAPVAVPAPEAVTPTPVPPLTPPVAPAAAPAPVTDVLPPGATIELPLK